MNSVLKEILDTGSVKTRDGRPLPVHSQLPRHQGEFLQQVILRHKPQVSLEVGLAYGISALYICDALAQCGAKRHIVIDPLQHGQSSGQKDFHYDNNAQWEQVGWSQETGWRGIGLHNLERAGHGGMIEFFNEASYLTLPNLVARKEKIDFAFIDGWHTYDYVFLDFFFIDLLLNVGGLVAFDDSNYPAIRKVLRYALTNRRYSVIAEQKGALPRQTAIGSLATRLGRKSARIGKALAPELQRPDAELRLPKGRCVVLRKDGDDVLGDGTGVSRNWDFHKPF